MASSFKGLVNLFEKLDKVEELTQEAIEVAVEKGAKIVQNKAKEEAPVDTGRLRNSIATKVETEGTTTTGYIYTNVEYAPMQEFGTSTQAGKPFLIPAINMEKERVVEVILEDIKQNLGKVGK